MFVMLKVEKGIQLVNHSEKVKPATISNIFLQKFFSFFNEKNLSLIHLEFVRL